MKIALVVGHSEQIRGMSGSPVPPQCEEVSTCLEACKAIQAMLEANGVECPMLYDTTSESQSEYLAYHASWANNQHADLAVEVHLNASDGNGHGSEVWYYTQEELAEKVSAAIAAAGQFTDRGEKYSSSLSWLVNTDAPAILLELFFGDNTPDCNLWREHKDAIIQAICESMTGKQMDTDEEPVPPDPERPPIEPPGEFRDYIEMKTAATRGVHVLINGITIHGRPGPLGLKPVVDITLKGHGDVRMEINGEMFHNHPPEQPELPPEPVFLLEVEGPCSWFGGPNDQGVSPSEGLAFIYEYDARPDLFLAQQPPGTTGLARRLNTDGVRYVACRWDYSVTPKTMLAGKEFMARVSANGRSFLAWPADWGPHEDTDRTCDLSRKLLQDLGITTDDSVLVQYPVEPEVA